MSNVGGALEDVFSAYLSLLYCFIPKIRHGHTHRTKSATDFLEVTWPWLGCGYFSLSSRDHKSLYQSSKYSIMCSLNEQISSVNWRHDSGTRSIRGCRSALDQDTEPLTAPDALTSAVWMCVNVCL